MVTGIYAKKFLRTLGFLALFAVIIGYGVWRSRDILFGIKLDVTGITDGMKTEEEILSFSGVAKHVSGITVNAQPIAASEDGSWKDTIALLPGYNVITITATDKFGRTIRKSYQVFYLVNEAIKTGIEPVGDGTASEGVE